MRNETICKAYDSVLPDAGTKERMLKNILSEASNTRPEGSITGMKTGNIKKTIIIIAAVLAAALSVTAIAYASDLFGFRALLIRTGSGDPGWGAGDDYLISINQPQDVPDGMDPDIADKLEKNRQAMEEWKASDPVYSTVQNPSCESGAYDGEYSRSEEEKTRLEETAEKYGLKLRGDITLLWSSETTGYTGDQFFTNAELVDIVSGACCSGTLFYETPVGFDKVYFWDEGTFCVSWYVNLPSSGVKYTCYGYNSMYGTLSDPYEISAFKENPDSFTERSHTAPDGTELTILSNGKEAYIYVYLENSFFTEHISLSASANDLRDSSVLTDEDIDYIADCIDYSVIGK